MSSHGYSIADSPKTANYQQLWTAMPAHQEGEEEEGKEQEITYY